MAGRGPAPKDPSERRRTNSDPIGTRNIEAEAVAQPDLPDFSVVVKKGDSVETEPFAWPMQTRRWWAMWRESPLADSFTSTDWDFLLDTALIHARLWRGDTSAAAELRLRVAKFGATPEDRARLRINLIPAKPEAPAAKRTSSAKARRERLLRAVSDDDA
jgi:hypothetical protein